MKGVLPIISLNASHDHSDIEKKFHSHVEKLLTQQEIDKVLPWVHTVIANAKMQLADTYHGTKTEFLQDYLNEFCYISPKTKKCTLLNRKVH